MKQNEEEEKKTKGPRRLLGYNPFSACTRSRYSNLYRDTGLGRLSLARVWGTHGRPIYGRLGHDTGHDTAGSARAAVLVDCV